MFSPILGGPRYQRSYAVNDSLVVCYVMGKEEGKYPVGAEGEPAKRFFPARRSLW